MTVWAQQCLWFPSLSFTEQIKLICVDPVVAAAAQLDGHSLGREKLWFVAAANFHSVNTPIMRPHWEQNWEAHTYSQDKPAPLHRRVNGPSIEGAFSSLDLSHHFCSIITGFCFSVQSELFPFPLFFPLILPSCPWSFLLFLYESWGTCIPLTVRIKKNTQQWVI